MTVPCDEVQKVFSRSDVASGDVSPHIALRSIVRVVHSPYVHCQGVVTEKCNQGQELIIMDPDNNKNVSLPHRSGLSLLLKSYSSRSPKTKSNRSEIFKTLQGQG